MTSWMYLGTFSELVTISANAKPTAPLKPAYEHKTTYLKFIP